jgi:hypothetical protein
MNLCNWRGLLLGAVLFNVPAMAATLFKTGFEPPTYTLGTFAGQDGWIGFGGMVENTVTNGGAQAVSVDSGSGPKLFSRPVTFSPVSGVGNVVKMTIDVFLSTSGTPSNGWVPVEAAGSTGSMGYIQVENTTATVAFGSSTSGSVTIVRGVWNTYELDVDMNAQTVTGYVNGTLIGSGPITGSPSNVFNKVEFGVPTGADGDLGYFDNLDVFTLGSMPDSEPAGVPTLSTGGLALLGVLLVGTAWYATMRRSIRVGRN